MFERPVEFVTVETIMNLGPERDSRSPFFRKRIKRSLDKENILEVENKNTSIAMCDPISESISISDSKPRISQIIPKKPKQKTTTREWYGAGYDILWIQ